MVDYHDYLIALSPSENMVDQLKKFKYFSYEKIGEFEGYDVKPDIIVEMLPGCKPQVIELLLPKLEHDLKSLPAVVLEIDGFELIDKDNRLGVYAKIEDNDATRYWFNKLAGLFSSTGFNPNLSIATNLNSDNAAELWPCFKYTNWNARMVIDRLSILKRPTIGDNKNFRLFKQIPLNLNLNFYDFPGEQLNMRNASLNKNNLQQVSMF